MIISKTKTPWSLRSLLLLGVATLGATSAEAQFLYNNDFNGPNDRDRLALYRGKPLTSIFDGTVGGRQGPMLRCLHTRASGWESILGNPELSSKAADATIRYNVFFPGGDQWRFRLQGKLPGLQPDLPHFGGNVNDAPEWNKWSVRLMWLSNTQSIDQGNDDNARPSIYIYDQNRRLGDFGTQHRFDPPFNKGQWYNIAMSVELNTYGGADGRTALSDGRVILRFNGVEVKRVTGLKLRGNIPTGTTPAVGIPMTQISKVAFHNYYGGSKDDPRNVPGIAETRCYFDSLDVFRGLTPPLP